MAKTPTSTQRALPYTQGTGSPGPGPYRGGLPDYSQTGVKGPLNFDSYGCKVFTEAPPTADWETATQYFERKVFNSGSLAIPEMGITMPFWGFEDTLKKKGQRLFPSPMIRLKAGEMTHVRLRASFGAHTIHHHGIEPTTMNDGVGHVSFETTGEYIYQFVPRHAGTWFYHCHVNTVLHFKMGLYGLLIVDPEEGWGRVHNGATKYRYDVEQFWVLDDKDPRWFSIDRQGGLCGEDVALNVFKPELFFINGVHKSRTAAASTSGQAHPVAVKAQKDQRILIRILNGSYSVAKVTIEDIPFECVAMDGHAMVGSNERPWATPYEYVANEPMLLPTAQRMDIWIDPTKIPPAKRRSRYMVNFEYLDWVTKKPHNQGQGLREGKAQTYIDINWA